MMEVSKQAPFVGFESQYIRVMLCYQAFIVHATEIQCR